MSGIKNKTGVYKRSEKQLLKIAETSFKKGHPQLNSGRTHFKKGRVMSQKEKESLSKRNKKMGISPPHYSGEKHWHWKGGITSENIKIRTSIEYKLWRKAVFERDWFTCIWCGYKGKEINADHIKPFALYPELRFAIDNGRTLCIPCHKTTNSWGKKANELEDLELTPEDIRTKNYGAASLNDNVSIIDK